MGNLLSKSKFFSEEVGSFRKKFPLTNRKIAISGKKYENETTKETH